MNKIIKAISITLLAALCLFYIFLPPINLTSLNFWVYILFNIVIFVLSLSITDFDIAHKSYGLSKQSYKIVRWLFVVTMGLIVVLLFTNIIMSPLFNSKKYANRINVEEDGNFKEEIAEVDFTKLPLLDKDSSQKLGDRVMGQLPELVSQFDVSNLYTQISKDNQILRVTPLEYNGLIKYFSNRKNGTSGYITVDSTTGESNIVKLENGMKYMPSAYFFENLDRKLRFEYPTEIFGEKSFELDDEGNPYWIVPLIKYTGINLKEEIKGIIVFNPIDGTSQKYKNENIPNWVDHVYSARLVIEKLDDWGRYRSGYINSIFGQKNVVATTEGYNYMVMNDDVYLYTGITSVVKDESNIGFILTNMRTSETILYKVPGAEEYSAMASAEGAVQQMNYNSTFPLLINLNGNPTYLISLKDNAGLVKMYAFVDVVDYQKVVVTDSSKGIEEASRNYLKDNMNINSNEVVVKKIVVKKIAVTTIDGNTFYYLVDANNKKYKASIKANDNKLPFIKIDDEIEINYLKEEEVTIINKIN